MSGVDRRETLKRGVALDLLVTEEWADSELTLHAGSSPADSQATHSLTAHVDA
jgi:hypothetical protein